MDIERLLAQMTEIVETAKAEERSLNAEEIETYERLEGDLKTARQSGEINKRHESWTAPSTTSGIVRVNDGDDAVNRAFNDYLRTGNQSGELRSQTVTGDGSQGGFMAPDGFRAKMVEVRKSFGGIASVAEILTTADGNPIRWPTNDDTSNSAVIATEGSAPGSAGADLVLGNVDLGAFRYAASGASQNPLKVSVELLADAAFDVEALVARKLGQRIARKMAADFANGAGTTEPVGLFTRTPTVLSAETTYPASLELMHAVDPDYRDNACWIMSDATLLKFKQAVDKNGRPLWLPNAESGMENAPNGTLHGKRVIVDQAAGAMVAFGDIAAGYIIRLVSGVTVIVNPYSSANAGLVEYNAWQRGDGQIQDSAAFRVADFTSIDPDAVDEGE